MMKHFLVLWLLTSSCASKKDVHGIQDDVFLLQTRVLEIEKNTKKDIESTSSQGKMASLRLANTAATMDTLKTEITALKGELNTIKRIAQMGALPGDTPSPNSLGDRLNTLEISMAQIQSQLAELLAKNSNLESTLSDLKNQNSNSKKKIELKALLNYADFSVAFNAKNYATIEKEAPLIIPKLKGNSKSQVQFIYAESLFKLGKLSDAALLFSELIKDKNLKSKQPLIHLRLGDCFRHLGKDSVATIYYNELLEKFPKSEFAAEAKKNIKKLTK